MAEKFADPDIDERTRQTVREIISEQGPMKPWSVLDEAVDRGVDRHEARKALRKFKLANTVVPAGDFTGDIDLAGD